MTTTSQAELTAVAERVALGRERILAEIRKVIVGQDAVIDQVLMALFTGGHCLITGVPGLAKTLLIKTLAQILDLSFKRIQFTPDLMPADITGTEVLDEADGHRSLRFVKGPIFAQILLADEINRTPPKTQAALLEAMQEYHVTAAGRTYPLERPFFVLATQNPIELEGTYPLPEAQLDRFMFNIVVSYLSEDDEVRVVTQTTGTAAPVPARVLSGSGDRRVPAPCPSGGGRRGNRQVCGAVGGFVASGTPAGSPVHQGLGEMGRRPSCVPVVDSGRQSESAHSGALPCVAGRSARTCAPDSAPPHHPELLRRVRTRGRGRAGRSPPRGRAAPPQRNVAMAPTATNRDLRFLDPAVIARLGGMELKARTVVEGFLAGLHRSPYKGFSVEFAEYRQYLPGDDLSTLDWKVFARSDRYYVKKFEEETNLECHLLLDISASMAYRGAAAMSKLEYGSVLAGSLAYLMNRQRDATGLIAFDRQIITPAPCARHARSSARDPADARAAGARQPVRRQPATAPAR